MKTVKASEDGWIELYAFAKILAEGTVNVGAASLEPMFGKIVGVSSIARQEKAAETVVYSHSSNGANIQAVKDDTIVAVAERKLVQDSLGKFLSEIKHGSGTSESGVGQELLEMLQCTSVHGSVKPFEDMRLRTVDGEQGFVIRSLVGLAPLLLGGTTDTNFVFCGERTNTPTEGWVIGALRLIRETFMNMKIAFGHFSYSGMDGAVFQQNLVAIDPKLPAMLAEIVLAYYETDKKSLEQLVDRLARYGAITDKLSMTVLDFKNAIKEFLAAAALGMNARQPWLGNAAAHGCIMVRQDGELLCYSHENWQAFKDYLYTHTELETSDRKRNAFGDPYERADFKQCIKLNLQIRLKK